MIVNNDTERLNYLERLLKQSPRLWDQVSIETLPNEMLIEPCNKHHGDAAGRVTGKTLREAVDKAMAGEFAEVLTS